LRSSRQLYELTGDQLLKLIDFSLFKGVLTAVSLMRKIREGEGTHAIFYSKCSGFLVIDEDDHEHFRRALWIRSRAKKFPI
jgi:hypothetical protein